MQKPRVTPVTWLSPEAEGLIRMHWAQEIPANTGRAKSARWGIRIADGAGWAAHSPIGSGTEVTPVLQAQSPE